MWIDSAILIVPLAAVIAPLLAALVRRALVVPLIVFEIGLGMLVGPAGLGWVAQGEILEVLSQLGLAMLFLWRGTRLMCAQCGALPGVALWAAGSFLLYLRLQQPHSLRIPCGRQRSSRLL